MNAFPNSPEQILLRANDGAARPIFSLATTAYGVVFVIAGIGMWDGRDGPTILGSAALLVGAMAMGAAVLGLLVPRWQRIATVASLPVAAFAGLAAVGLVGTLALPGAAGLDPAQMVWAMALGVFSVMWSGTTLLARAVDEREAGASRRADVSTPRRTSFSASSADLAA